MQRPIKFRGWNKQSHIMVENIQCFAPNSTFNLNDAFDDDMVVVPLQYTGLKDKNGKEIYEGDIVTEKGGVFIGIVQLGEYSSFGYDAKDEEHLGWFAFRPTDGRKQPLCELYQIEVIGNIYENPELLGDKE